MMTLYLQLGKNVSLIYAKIASQFVPFELTNVDKIDNMIYVSFPVMSDKYNTTLVTFGYKIAL
jgi:hypothetical protein